MSYGQNAPWGLQAVRTQVDASWNGKTTPYLIQSGYAQNIFKGDLVYISTNGYIQNLYDISAGGQNNYTVNASLGVFDGCSFTVPTIVNPIDPANPGRPYWPAGTNTLGGVPATAFIITDPQVVYNAQMSDAGVIQANIGSNIKVVYQVIAGLVQGNFSQGTSLMSLDSGTISRQEPTYNCYIDAISPYPTNIAGQQYNNAEVLIANHYFRVMATIPNAA